MNETQIKNIIFDYMNEKIPFKEFKHLFSANPCICNYLQNIADNLQNKGTVIPLTPEHIFKQKFPDLTYKPYGLFNEHFKNVKDWFEWCFGIHGNRMFVEGSLYDILYSIFYTANNSTPYNWNYYKRFTFALTAIPNYIGGEEVDEYIQSVIEALPTNITESNRMKLCKQRLRDEFGIKGKNYPHWAQEAEWPLGSDGKPALYQKRTSNRGSDLVVYHFIDRPTGKEILITQAY